VTQPVPPALNPSGWQTPVAATLPERNRCIDRALAARTLNEYGDPEGTTYEEGSPLSVTMGADRYDYVMHRQPGIGAECSRIAGEPQR
jgi:hypothetical protein